MLEKTILRQESLCKIKLIGFVFFFLILVGSSLSAKDQQIEVINYTKTSVAKLRGNTNFEITSAFISTWKVKEMSSHTTLEVAKIADFKTTYEIVAKLKEITNQSIMVHHGYESNTIVYTIVLGRFSNVEDAINYHNLLR